MPGARALPRRGYGTGIRPARLLRPPRIAAARRAPDVRRHRTGGGIRTRSHKRVEAIRWLICEAEVQQAIGRVRGVRRMAGDPVLVIVLNGVDLGQTPIHQLISWEDLLELCGPVSQMAVGGIVPKLWADVAAVCAPRWSEAEDPGQAAKPWFSRHPEEKAKLARVWRTNEALVGRTGSAATGLPRSIRQAPPPCLACRRHHP